MVPRVKGTQDFLDLTLFNLIVDKAKKYLMSCNFSEIQTPIIEYLDLFQRSLGLETDVVSKEMFIIESHGESHERICLRPEATAPTVRAFIENGVQITPWKVFCYGPMFRYERPQKGRFRQFHQISIEIIGSHAIAQDAAFILMLDDFFSKMIGLSQYSVDINFLGCIDDRKRYVQALKLFMDTDARAQGVCAQCKERKERNIMRIFDCKNEQCQQIYCSAPMITEFLCTTCSQEWQELQGFLSVRPLTFVHRPTLVRGLDYYNKTVFEFVSNALGAQNAFCGGGRYNQLAKELGAHQDYPSVGAAIGIERLILLLEPIVDKLVLPKKPDLHIIIPMEQAQHNEALLLAEKIRSVDLSTDILFEGSFKHMLRFASKLGAVYVLIVGETESFNKTVTIKNMETGIQQTVAQYDVVSTLLEKKI